MQNWSDCKNCDFVLSGGSDRSKFPVHSSGKKNNQRIRGEKYAKFEENTKNFQNFRNLIQNKPQKSRDENQYRYATCASWQGMGDREKEPKPGILLRVNIGHTQGPKGTPSNKTPGAWECSTTHKHTHTHTLNVMENAECMVYILEKTTHYKSFRPAPFQATFSVAASAGNLL